MILFYIINANLTILKYILIREIMMKKDEIKTSEKNGKKIELEVNDILLQIVYWIFAICTIFYFKNVVFETNTQFIKNIAFIGMIVIAVTIDIIFIVFKKIKLEPHKQFIILSIILGIFYFIATPFGNGTDEVSHFLRVFKISQKYTNIHLYEDTLFPPAFSKLVDYKNNRYIEYENYINEFEAFSMNSDERKDLIQEYWNIRLYSPIQYIPQAIGVTAGRIISDNIVLIGMIGRLTGYIFWVACCAISIKLIPNKKTFLLILCLLPVNIFSAICISGDTVTNAVCTLFIALIYRKVYLKEKINKKEKILIGLLACLMALCKIVYLPFVTLLVLLKESNFESKKECKNFIIIAIILSVIVGFAWLMVGTTNLVNSNSASKDQLKFILENPLEYITVIMRTFTQKGAQYIYQLCTGDELMCHAKTTIYPIVSYVVSIALILSLFTNNDDKDIEVNYIRKLWVGLIMFGTSLLIITAIYIQWTSLFEIGCETIQGIQGRYFIPVVALLIFVIKNIKLQINDKYLTNAVILMQLPVLCQIMNCFI